MNQVLCLVTLYRSKQGNDERELTRIRLGSTLWYNHQHLQGVDPIQVPTPGQQVRLFMNALNNRFIPFKLQYANRIKTYPNTVAGIALVAAQFQTPNSMEATDNSVGHTTLITQKNPSKKRLPNLL